MPLRVISGQGQAILLLLYHCQRSPLPMNLQLQKSLIIVVWLAVIANLLLPTPGWLDQTLKVVGIFLVVAHVLECLLFNRKIRANHKPAIRGFLMVMVFGVVHLNTLPDYSGR